MAARSAVQSSSSGRVSQCSTGVNGVAGRGVVVTFSTGGGERDHRKPGRGQEGSAVTSRVPTHCAPLPEPICMRRPPTQSWR